MRATTYATLALALGAAVGTLAPAAACINCGIKLNGISLNGLKVNGASTNGMRVNGTEPAGTGATAGAGGLRVRSVRLPDGRALAVAAR